MHKKYCLNVPVADLRREPKPAFISHEKDPLQESQLLLGDRVTAIQESGSWIHVEVPEQTRFHSDLGWSGYKGWILKEQLLEVNEWPLTNLIVKASWADLFQGNKLLNSVSMGTKLEGIQQRGDTWRIRLPDGQEATIGGKSVRKLQRPDSLDSVRPDILAAAAELLDSPYVWGGRSAHRPDWRDVLTGVDCSGYVSLLYRVHGLSLPRDAQDQFLASSPSEIGQLKAADLIFLASEANPQCMTHVMLYAGGDSFLDANITDKKVVKSSAKERFGMPFRDMAWGQPVGKYRVFFGAVS